MQIVLILIWLVTLYLNDLLPLLILFKLIRILVTIGLAKQSGYTCYLASLIRLRPLAWHRVLLNQICLKQLALIVIMVVVHKVITLWSDLLSQQFFISEQRNCLILLRTFKSESSSLHIRHAKMASGG
jgi:hypothetical protein